MSAIRQALEALVSETLADRTGATGYAVTAVAFSQAVEITLEKGDARFAIWLRPASHESSSYRQTARFKIGHDPDPPDRQGYAVIDAVCARIAAWESSLADDAAAHLFDPRPATPADAALTPEWMAVRAGLKPACRYVVGPQGADALIEHARDDDLSVRVTPAGAFVADFCSGGMEHTDTIVHVARTDAAADAAAGAERAMIETCTRGERATDTQVRALGAALGYPPCCVEAFLPVRDCPNSELYFHALRRTPGPISRLLNNIVTPALVTHALCRYDCTPSLAYAQALLRELARAAAAMAEKWESRLGGLMIVFRREGAVRLQLDGAQSATPYRYGTVDAWGEGPRLEEWRDALRAADGLVVLGGIATVLRGAKATARFDAPADEIQMGLFR